MRYSRQIDTAIRNINWGNVVGKSIKHTHLRSLVQDALRPFGVSVRIRRDEFKRDLRVSGVYLPEKELPLVILHAQKYTTEIRMTKTRVDRVIFLVSQVAQHELIHQAQDDYTPKRYPIKFSNKLIGHRKRMINYLNDWYEVEAYAHDLAVDIQYYYPRVPPEKILRNIESYPKLFAYRYYAAAFRGVDWGRIKKDLLRTCWRWLPKIQSIPSKLHT